MVTEQLTKAQFIAEILNRDVINIYRAQLLIAEKNIRLEGSDFEQKKRKGAKLNSRTGLLLERLRNPDYQIIEAGGRFELQSNIALQTRFLDMKRNGSWLIYNRQVWGILYRKTLLDIKYGYGRQVRDNLGEALCEAWKNNK